MLSRRDYPMRVCYELSGRAAAMDSPRNPMDPSRHEPPHQGASAGIALRNDDPPRSSSSSTASVKTQHFLCSLSDDLGPAFKRLAFHHLHCFEVEINLI
jgi:hypothetical protein